MSASPLALLAATALLTFAAAHPTRYPALRDVVCTGSTPPQIISYHTHIIYMLTNQDQVKGAIDLRQRARTFFSDYLGPDCDGRYDEGRLCLIDDHPFNISLPDGPFPVGEWSIFTPVHYFSLVVPWLFQNRGEFTLLVHPNTGCEYEDHSIWALWAGDKWPLDMSIFTQGTQTNEFNETVGDAGNPTCLSVGQACGSPFYTGPALPCCGRSYCQCDPATQRACKCSSL
eukprot:m.232525 g.232525  ORF g.232525 m.232525 type:complete len:229 (-) comp12371_c0_seq1:64-750(-)